MGRTSRTSLTRRTSRCSDRRSVASLARRGTLLTMLLAALLVAGCQSSTPSTTPTHILTTEQTAKLRTAIAGWDNLSRLNTVLETRALDARLAAAIRTWNLRHDLRLALANRTAAQEFIAFIKSTSAAGAALVENHVELAVFRSGRDGIDSALILTAPNECAVDLPGQNPPPVSRATLRWLRGQPAVDPANPPPVSEETLQWIEEHANDPDPANPPPVSEATLQWIEDHAGDVDPANPPPVSEETLQWIEEHANDPDPGDPPPVSEETLQWIEQHEGTDPPPVSEETLQWIEEQEAAAQPPPVSEETLQWIEEHANDPDPGDPPPVSEETLQWIEEHANDVDPSNPPPVSEETLRWIEEQEAQPSSPAGSPPPPSPQATSRTCNWFIDEPSGGGRIHGQKCGDPTGEWIVDGTYDRGGFKGEQSWTITINADESTGTFTYVVSSKGAPFGSPVTVYLVGVASGNVTMTVSDDGSVHMRMVETKHTYATTTSAGGEGSDVGADLETYRLDWLVGGTC